MARPVDPKSPFRGPNVVPGGGTAPEADASLYLHPQTLARLSSLELRAKMIVEGVMSGQHRSPYQGYSVEFAQHRPYVRGDDIRHLDWKVFGRSDKLYLKQYEQETSLDLVLLVDCSGSMNFGSRLFSEASGEGRATSPDGRSNWTKYDHATAVAAALAYLALSQGDRVGLGIYADSLVDALNRTSAMGQWRRVVGVLSHHPVDRPTDFARVVEQTLAKLNNRCLIAIISDFFDDPERIRAALARVRHKQHDVLMIQVVDRREETFDLTDTAPFVGLEGEPKVRIDPRAVRAAYLEAFGRHLDAVEKITRSFGFDYLKLSTHDWLGPALAAFVSRRNAVIKRSKSG
ncbi:MAG: DUF58 domain-containing protein [Phycisphaerales bacterium]|nr:DUF58 domain-containing protein [Phycisphaerales bacterium]